MKKSAAKKETPKKSSSQVCGEEGRCPQEEGRSQEEGRQGSGEPSRLSEATDDNIRRRGLQSLRRVPLPRTHLRRSSRFSGGAFLVRGAPRDGHQAGPLGDAAHDPQGGGSHRPAGHAGPYGEAAHVARGQDPAGDREGESKGAASFVLKSQTLPEPRVILPTDALPPPRGPKLRIAAITTAYFKYSHADDIITKFIEGYAILGRTHQPHASVVSLAIEQFPASDIGRGLAARYGIPIFDTPAAALGLGGPGGTLAVDGVILVGEHGEYPFNAKGQELYPRCRLFEEIIKVFRRSGRSVPVYNDKHFSYDWPSAAWMYDQSRALGFPMMAGSSVPVAWRRPPLALRPGIVLEGALALGFGGLEVYGFHTLELLQAFVERRRGGEVGDPGRAMPRRPRGLGGGAAGTVAGRPAPHCAWECPPGSTGGRSARPGQGRSRRGSLSRRVQ